MSRTAAFALLVLYAAPARAQDTVAIDIGHPLADASAKRIGVNINYLLDDDGNRPRAIRSLAEALRTAGVKYLRYPGGEKSDAYLWSVPPYTASIPTLARWAAGEWPQNQEWPSYDRALVESDGHTWKTDPLTFDEFMDVCRAIDCIPTLVVCYDSMYKPAQPGGVAPTHAQLVETAREWVRYANLIKGYGVKYWEIGNESFQNHYNGGTTADNYARDLIEFSQAMKGVDPSIQIGANGQAWDWWQTILSTASPDIDFLAVHNYPAYSWPSYDAYRANASSLTSMVQIARDAIAAYARPADRNRLTIAITETGAASWSGSWPDLNDLGHALLLFQIFGEQLRDPLVQFSQLWTTRWSGNDTTPVPVLWDAFDRNNDLQATAQVLSIWNQALTGQFVQSTSTPSVASFAIWSDATNALRVMLVNRDVAAHTIALAGAPSSATMHRWTFGGDGPADLHPVFIDRGVVDVNTASLQLAVEPVSITILEFTPRPSIPAHAIPDTVQAEDFDDNGYWDSSPGNNGRQYRTTGVDIEATADAGGGFNVGWITPGEWLEYTIAVAQPGTYTLSLRVASPTDDSAIDVLIDGQLTRAGLAVPNTGWWQTWTTVQLPVSLAAGTHVVRLATSTGGFNLNWFSLTSSVTPPAPVPGHAVPGVIIEAEDFDDGRFFDTTDDNAGGFYRVTDVDIEPTSDAGGGFNVGWIAAGEWLEYTIQATQSGAYDVSVRFAAPSAGASAELWVDGLRGAVLTIPATGAWQAWTTVHANVSLTAGLHVVRLMTATGGFNVNWMGWQLGGVTPPPSTTGRVEAEDFDDGAFWDRTPENSGGAYRATAVDIEATTDAGGGYNVGWIEPDEWLEYTIDVAAPGTYRFSLRVASPVSDATLDLSIDGVPIASSLAVPNTGWWQNWGTVTTPGVVLTAGLHRLRVSTRTGSFNINWIAWSP